MVAQLTALIAAGGPVMWPLLGCCGAMIYLVLGIWLRPPPAVADYPCCAERRLAQRLGQLAAERRCETARLNLQAVKLLSMVAPLLGLLGTVSGMITMFNAMALYGRYDPAVVSGGISMAMITTQTGLIVGISGALLFFLGRRQLRRQLTQGGRDHAR